MRLITIVEPFRMTQGLTETSLMETPLFSEKIVFLTHRIHQNGHWTTRLYLPGSNLRCRTLPESLILRCWKFLIWTIRATLLYCFNDCQSLLLTLYSFMQQNSKFFEIIIKFIKVFWMSYFFLKKKILLLIVQRVQNVLLFSVILMIMTPDICKSFCISSGFVTFAFHDKTNRPTSCVTNKNQHYSFYSLEIVDFSLSIVS